MGLTAAGVIPLVALAVAAAASAGLTEGVRRLALARNALDRPNARKLHTTPVPRVGGVAVALALILGVAAASLWTPPDASAAWIVIGITTAAIVVTGAVDDVRGLSARTKLVVEVAAATLAIMWLPMPGYIELGNGVTLALGSAGAAVGVVWIVTLTNAMNMLDVADGVSAGTGAIAAGALGVASLLLGNAWPAIVLLALSGGLLGFLPHNLRGRIFLGDSGSLSTGFLLGWGSLAGLEREGTWLILPAILALGAPLAEGGLTVARRSLHALTIVRPGSHRERFLIWAGRLGLFEPDRRHIPHRLLELGLGPRRALLTLYLTGGALGVLSIATIWQPGLALAVVVVVGAGLLYVAPRWLYEELRLFDRGAFLPLLETRALHNRVVHVLYDGSAVVMAFWLSRLLLADNRLASPGAVTLLGTLVLALLTLSGFRVAGLYRGSYRQAGMAETARAVRAAVVGGALGIGGYLLLWASPGPFALWLLHLYLVVTAVVGARLAFAVLEHVYQRNQAGGRRALIVGAHRAGALALHEMLSRPELGLLPIGFVDDDPGTGRREYRGYPVHPGGDHLEVALGSLRVSDVVIPAGALSEDRLAVVRAVCESHRVRVLDFGVHWMDGGSAAQRAPAEDRS